MASHSCLMPATCRQPGSWWPWVAQGGHCLAGDTWPRPSCSQLGTAFMIVMGKSAGEGGGDGGIDKGVPPLPQHSALLPSHRTFIEDRNGAWVAGDCPESAGEWGAGQAEVVVLGGPGAVEVRAAAVLGPLLQVPLAARDWAPLGTPCRPWHSSTSSAAASINTKVCKSLSSVRCCQGTGAGARESDCPVALLGPHQCQGVTRGCWPGAPVSPDRSPRRHRRHHLGRAMVGVGGHAGAQETCGTPCPITSPTLPAIPPMLPPYLCGSRASRLAAHRTCTGTASHCWRSLTQPPHAWGSRPPGEGKGQGWGHLCYALARQGCGMHSRVQSSTPMCRVRDAVVLMEGTPSPEVQ